MANPYFNDCCLAYSSDRYLTASATLRYRMASMILFLYRRWRSSDLAVSQYVMNAFILWTYTSRTNGLSVAMMILSPAMSSFSRLADVLSMISAFINLSPFSVGLGKHWPMPLTLTPKSYISKPELETGPEQSIMRILFLFSRGINGIWQLD